MRGSAFRIDKRISATMGGEMDTDLLILEAVDEVIIGGPQREGRPVVYGVRDDAGLVGEDKLSEETEGRRLSNEAIHLSLQSQRQLSHLSP